MKEQLALLVELQKLDLKIHDLKGQQQQMPVKLKLAETPVTEGKRRLDDIASILKVVGAERRSGEQDLSAQESHIAKLRARLADLKTNKEYQAHLFEIEQAHKKKDALEEKILLILERVEQKQHEFAQAESQIVEAEKAFKEEKARLESQEQRLVQEVAELELRYQELAKQVDKKLLKQYMSLKSKVNVLALVPVRGTTCQGCQLQLPPQLVAEVKRGQELLTCAYCHRILYWEAPGDIVPTNHPPEQIPSASLLTGNS